MPAITLVLSVITGRASFGMTFGLFWLLPQAIIWGISIMMIVNYTSSGQTELSPGDESVIIFFAFIAFLVNLVIGPGVLLSAFRDGELSFVRIIILLFVGSYFLKAIGDLFSLFGG